jgi:DNA repair protein RecO (recombination protein O)
MNVFETEAIILSCKDHGESDRLIAFYGEIAGRLKGIAKGARRSKKRFVHTFEPCSLVRLTYRVRKGLVWIEACSLLEPHLGLRAELKRWGYAALVSEIVLEMVPEGESQPELFSLLKGTLDQMAVTTDLLNVVLLFLLRFLHLMGYLPLLERCIVCHRPLRSSTYWWWQVHQGILVCSEHHPNPTDENRLRLDLGTLVLIHQSRSFPLTRIWRLRVSQHRKVPLLNALLGSVREHIGKDLRSLRLLDQLQSA